MSYGDFRMASMLVTNKMSRLQGKNMKKHNQKSVTNNQLELKGYVEKNLKRNVEPPRAMPEAQSTPTKEQEYNKDNTA